MSMDEREDLTQGDATASEQSPQEIEFEIERTRERMSSNIDEIGERLRPDNLKQQAKDAIANKAQDVVANVGDQARQTGGRMMDFITEHPLPVAAVGLGAIWLFTLRRGNRSDVSGDRMARFAYTGPERRQPNGHPGLGRRLVDRAASMRHTVEALGMLLPETDPERRLMGDTREELGERVSNVASRVKDAAMDAGRQVQETVREEFQQRAPEVTDTLRQAAEHVKEEVKDAATNVAQEAKDEAKRPTGRKR
jgi:hypothetical protein